MGGDRLFELKFTMNFPRGESETADDAALIRPTGCDVAIVAVVCVLPRPARWLGARRCRCR